MKNKNMKLKASVLGCTSEYVIERVVDADFDNLKSFRRDILHAFIDAHGIQHFIVEGEEISDAVKRLINMYVDRTSIVFTLENDSLKADTPRLPFSLNLLYGLIKEF